MLPTELVPTPTETDLLHHGGGTGRWASLGLWPAADAPMPDYAGACAALARAIAKAATLPAGARVLAPGCGGGEELRLWQQEFQVGEVLGVDPDPALHPIDPAPAVLHGHAAEMHRLAGGDFDAVLANDCAYHFGPRATWLRAAAAALKPGGRIAFADLVLEPRGIASRRLAPLLARVLRHPAIGIAELRSEAAIRQALVDAGFADIASQRLDDAVLGGFVRYATAQGQRLGEHARGPAWRRVARTARALPVCRALGLGYALFTAVRR